MWDVWDVGWPAQHLLGPGESVPVQHVMEQAPAHANNVMPQVMDFEKLLNKDRDVRRKVQIYVTAYGVAWGFRVGTGDGHQKGGEDPDDGSVARPFGLGIDRALPQQWQHDSPAATCA